MLDCNLSYRAFYAGTLEGHYLSFWMSKFCESFGYMVLLLVLPQPTHSMPNAGVRGYLPAMTENAKTPVKQKGSSNPEVEEEEFYDAGSEDQRVEDMKERGEKGVLSGPAWHAPPGMPRLDVKTYEGLKKACAASHIVEVGLETACSSFWFLLVWSN